MNKLSCPLLPKPEFAPAASPAEFWADRQRHDSGSGIVWASHQFTGNANQSVRAVGRCPADGVFSAGPPRVILSAVSITMVSAMALSCWSH